jgi:hypothetical protein
MPRAQPLTAWPADKCKKDACTMPINSLGFRNKGSCSFYCRTHECAQDGCSTERTSSVKSLCETHACDYQGCDEPRSEDKNWLHVARCHKHWDHVLEYEEDRRQREEAEAVERRSREEAQTTETCRQKEEERMQLLDTVARLTADLDALEIRYQQELERPVREQRIRAQNMPHPNLDSHGDPQPRGDRVTTPIYGGSAYGHQRGHFRSVPVVGSRYTYEDDHRMHSRSSGEGT